ncbi:capsular polysaccharide export protein, LipB/KpsS family [Caminibacter pacificus]
MKEREINCLFIVFHEGSVEYIKKQGFEVFNIFERIPTNIPENIDWDEYFYSYGIENPSLLMSHERVAFNITVTDKIIKKYYNYLQALETIFLEIFNRYGKDLKVVHELGGFASITSVFYISQKYKIDNIFVEPSFFRGKVFFVKNSIYAPTIPKSDDIEPSDEMIEYLQETIKNKKIVIPKKDTKGYNDVIKKIINPYNIKRLFQKLYDKYILKRQEEFSYIGFHVVKHLKMLFNQYYFSYKYSKIPNEKFFYYPLHVPNDVALTLRSPLYLDQYALIDFIARNLPVSFKLAIKEHPAMIGSVDRGRICDLLNRYDNIVFLNPKINNFEILEKAQAIVTVNSKAGAEALLFKKKIVVTGDAFYKNESFVFKPECYDNIKEGIFWAKEGDLSLNEREIEKFFARVWKISYPGELYYNEKENIETFTNSLVVYFEQEGENL